MSESKKESSKWNYLPKVPDEAYGIILNDENNCFWLGFYNPNTHKFYVYTHSFNDGTPSCKEVDDIVKWCDWEPPKDYKASNEVKPRWHYPKDGDLPDPKRGDFLNGEECRCFVKDDYGCLCLKYANGYFLYDDFGDDPVTDFDAWIYADELDKFLSN